MATEGLCSWPVEAHFLREPLTPGPEGAGPVGADVVVVSVMTVTRPAAMSSR